MKGESLGSWDCSFYARMCRSVLVCSGLGEQNTNSERVPPKNLAHASLARDICDQSVKKKYIYICLYGTYSVAVNTKDNGGKKRTNFIDI